MGPVLDDDPYPVILTFHPLIPLDYFFLPFHTSFGRFGEEVVQLGLWKVMDAHVNIGAPQVSVAHHSGDTSFSFRRPSPGDSHGRVLVGCTHQRPGAVRQTS